MAGLSILAQTYSEDDAALYEAPFEYVVKYVKPERETNNREAYRKYYWRHGEPRVAMRAALADLVAFYRNFRGVQTSFFYGWLDSHILPDKRFIVVRRSDDTTFGILHSRFHELWSLDLAHTLEERPRYTPNNLL